MSHAQQRGAFDTVSSGGARMTEPAVAFSPLLSLTHCGSGDSEDQGEGLNNGALVLPSLPTFFLDFPSFPVMSFSSSSILLRAQ